MITLYRSLIGRYLRGKLGRNVVTTLGIALGVTMVVAVGLTNGAIISSYETLLGGVAGRADLQITPYAGQGFPVTVLSEVESIRGVKAAVSSVSSASQIAFGDKKSSAMVYGIEPAKDGLIRDYKLTEGRQVGRGREIAITTELAKGLGLKVGDSVKLLSTTGFEEFAVVGLFDAKGTVRGALGPFAVMPLAAAQLTFGKESVFDTIDIMVADSSAKAAVEKAIGEAVSGQARVGTPLERSKDMQKLLDSVVFSLAVAGSISLFAGAFIIYTNISMGVAERRRDLAILRALGMRRREVMTLVLAEVGLVGLAGSTLGFLWGYGLASTMARQLTGQFLAIYGIQASQVSVGVTDIVVALAVGVGISLFAAYGPANETARISPVDAMRPDDINSEAVERHGWARAVVGLGLIAGSALFIWATWPKHSMLPPLTLRAWGLMDVVGNVGFVVLLPVLLPLLNRYLLRPLQERLFGVPGRLASDNLIRRPRRTAATISALVISLTFMVGMGGMGISQRGTFEDWFKKRIGWDLLASTSYVGAASQVEMAPSLVEDLANVPGVKLVSPQKMGLVVLPDGQPSFLQVFDHRLSRQYSNLVLEEGDEGEVVEAMERGGAALISPSVAHRLGVKVGDNLNMPTPEGERPFRIVGLLKDVASFGGLIEIDRQDYVRYWQDETASNVAVLVADPSQAEQVRQAMLDRWGASANLSVRSNREFWAELKGVYDSFYGLTDGLTWIAVLVSGLAIANTLFASILERRREFGILRAVGTRRGEVIRVVVGEALSIGLIGGTFGIAGGFVTQVLFVRSAEFTTGASIDLAFPWTSIAQALVVAVLLAPLVGLLPARWAARLDIVDALRYE